MTTKQRAPAKKKQPAATETSRSIEDQTKAFLENGGVIEQIKSGVSGQESMVGRKQINLNSKPKPAPEAEKTESDQSDSLNTESEKADSK